MRKPGVIRRVFNALLYAFIALVLLWAATEISVAIYLVPLCIAVLQVVGSTAGPRDRKSAKRFEDYMVDTTDETMVNAVYGYDLPVLAMRTRSLRMVIVEPTFIQLASESELRGAAALTQAGLRSDRFSGRPIVATTAIFVALFVLFSLLPTAAGINHGTEEIIAEIFLGSISSMVITSWLTKQVFALMTSSDRWLEHFYKADREALIIGSEEDVRNALTAMAEWTDQNVASKSQLRNFINLFSQPVKVKYVFRERLEHLGN